MSDSQLVPLQGQTRVGSSPRRTMRRRIRKACEPCRRRKVKCDGGNPCELCLGYDYSCIYAKNEVTAVEKVSPPSNISPATPSKLPEKLPVTSISPGEDVKEPGNKLYVLSEEQQSPRTANTRFTRVDSAIAFPRSLGLSLDAGDPPRLQAFAWNTGTRRENLEVIRPNLFEYITLQDVETFSNIYFSDINPIFGISIREEFDRRVSHCWKTQDIDAGFEVVLCGVVALGSLFSSNMFMHEAAIVEQARLTLDHTFAHSRVLLSVDFVVGWILRAIYLRSTTRPHVSWMASSMAMHIAESIGLHQELGEIKMTQKAQSQSHFISEAEIETRRKIFWVASSLNQFLSAQYGRTMTVLQNITCRYPKAGSDDVADDLVGIIRLVPYLCDKGSPSSVAVLTEGIMQLGKLTIQKQPLLLLRAEAVFGVYRKVRYIGAALSPAQTEVVLSVITSALDAADSLTAQSKQWWTIVGVPFHSICVLLALNTMESLCLLHKAMETLQNVAIAFSSHVSREAARTAHYLVKVAEKKRRGELECLQRCLNLNTNMSASPYAQISSSEMLSDLPSFEWPTDVDLGFSDFLDASYIYEDTSMQEI
ncbi:Protein RDR1 [Lachnellula suecica]|uniref:Protein RDR1 n=1 Tax=Lachnellula suecica TaxID=602035 RepID=A0A8T9CBX4_9HELO|nr:Protein RDR1 [Lachnellula suecica]